MKIGFIFFVVLLLVIASMADRCGYKDDKCHSHEDVTDYCDSYTTHDECGIWGLLAPSGYCVCYCCDE